MFLKYVRKQVDITADLIRLHWEKQWAHFDTTIYVMPSASRELFKEVWIEVLSNLKMPTKTKVGFQEIYDYNGRLNYQFKCQNGAIQFAHQCPPELPRYVKSRLKFNTENPYVLYP